MNDWKQVKLGDICTLNYGKSLVASKRVTGSVPVYSSAGIIDWHNEALIDGQGIIVGRKGTVGSVYLSTTPFFCIDTAYYILPDETKYNLYYLYYRLKSLGLETLNEDSAVPGLNRETAYAQKFLLPPINIQCKIGKFLKRFEDKIRVNQLINDNLLEQAQAIFKSWFVDFEPWKGNVPSNWEFVRLGNFVEIKRGGSPRPIQNFLTDSGLRWLKISDVTGCNSPFITNIKEHIKKEGLTKTVFLKAGSLVLSNSATPGIPKILDVDSCIHDGWLYFTQSEFSNEFLYLLFIEIRKELILLGNGSIFTNLKTDILKNFNIVKPAREILKNFDEIVQPIFSQLRLINTENQRLAELRAALLPRLMSGELDVSEVEI